jgi:hypothetical protein
MITILEINGIKNMVTISVSIVVFYLGFNSKTGPKIKPSFGLVFYELKTNPLVITKPIGYPPNIGKFFAFMRNLWF